MNLKKFIILLIISIFGITYSQNNAPKETVIIDKNGIMRWEKSNKEVHGFGVNYTVPFAHAYRNAKLMGIDPKQAIDNDVYHFTRLGFDLFRVHVWDTQISDVEGNLLENDHLETFDYLLKKLKAQNIKCVVTPIAFWGDGWPEPDSQTPGFSNKYGKEKALTDKEAIKAQQNYLFQFLNHINPYTGIAYKDEPNIIAFEVSNEPHHRGKPEDVTKFVKAMINAMKKTGTKKPIFYNMSHAVQFVDAYFKGGAEGGTFQWYPTGLGYQRQLSGNLLPNVNDYNIPFDTIFKKHQGAKLVYEFDAADVGRSYIYPAMARSFRSAGIQIATHFSYDPTYLAAHNTEYNTHYMNLNYTPQKALSLKISAEVFREIAIYSDFGTYPKNNSFDNFRVDYLNDLAEYNTEDKFFYTNTTTTMPKNKMNLREIAGFGNSSVVKYDGTGAYFLDKIEDGLWRLEVLPDAIWVDNPFGRNSLNKTVGVIKWETHQMQINLKDLNENFEIEAINDGNMFATQTSGISFEIRPGTYMLTRKGVTKKWLSNDAFKTNKLNDFFAPETTVTKPWLKHKLVEEVTENQPLEVMLQYVAPDTPESIQVVGYVGSEHFAIDLIKSSTYQYKGVIPADKIVVGYLNYHIIVNSGNAYITYPVDKEGRPFEWDFYDRKPYKIAVVPKSNPIYLFNAYTDSDRLVKEWRSDFILVPTENQYEAAYQMNIEELFVIDNENLNAKLVYDYSFKHFIIDKIKGRKDDLKSTKELIFYGSALNNKPCKLQIAFVLDDGSAFGKVLEIGTELKQYKLTIDDLRPVKTVTLPRPYPSFLPYYLEHEIPLEFGINRIESLQFSIGPEIPQDELNDSHGISIISVRLE